MTKQEDGLVRFQQEECVSDFRQMFFTQLSPFLSFCRKGIRFENWQGNERRSHAEEHIPADFPSPEWLKTQFLRSPVPACHSHSPLAPKKAEFAKLMVTKCST